LLFLSFWASCYECINFLDLKNKIEAIHMDGSFPMSCSM
jgi:hypothetical protein